MNTVRIELIFENTCIMQLQIGELFAYVLIEDTFRKAELHKDFPHLFPKIYKTEQEFEEDDSGYNFIKLTLFPLFDLKTVENEKLGEFEWLATNLVEHRFETNCSTRWIDDELIRKMSYEMNVFKIESWTDLYNRILSFTEKEVKQLNYIPGHLISKRI